MIIHEYLDAVSLTILLDPEGSVEFRDPEGFEWDPNTFPFQTKL